MTAVLRDILANGLIRYSRVTRLGDVNVTVLPPDRIDIGADEPNQLNLFMYRVSPHATLAAARPGRSGEDGVRRAPMLSLDLHYLLTAYGAQDLHREILLGCAVHLLNSTPVLTPDVVRESLRPASANAQKHALSPARAALAAADLPRGPGHRVTQQFLSFEDLSKLWSVLQARYRPSVTYEVSAVTMPADGAPQP